MHILKEGQTVQTVTSRMACTDYNYIKSIHINLHKPAYNLKTNDLSLCSAIPVLRVITKHALFCIADPLINDKKQLAFLDELIGLNAYLANLSGKGR